MQLETINQIEDVYAHVYLSPHLDDAALSCGGAIAAQLAAGERVLVVTISTASPPPAGPFSALAQELHSNWGLAADQAVAARLVEEREAMQRLGVDYYWLGRLDAIYRYPEAYHTREALFSSPAPNDPLFIDLHTFFGALRERVPGATFYAPLGVGSHVDHLLTHAASRIALGAAVRFYEDLPYAANEPGALDARMRQLNEPASPTAISIDATLAQKLHAVHAYASQLKELFGGPDAMEQTMTDYAASVAPPGKRYGERVWQVGGG